MNIFVLDRDPQLAARYHCDKHCMKMIIEYAQLMSTAHFLRNSEVKGLYKPTHVKHPCAIWTNLSKSNYRWLYKLFLFLSSEYANRYLREHATYLYLHEKLADPPENQPEIGLTPFALAMPDKYKKDDPVESYRDYYLSDKLALLRWTSPASVPTWVHLKREVAMRSIRGSTRYVSRVITNL